MNTCYRRLHIVSVLAFCLSASFLPAQPADSRESSELPPALDAPKPETTDGAVIKLALLLDTSSSMDGLINQARSHLWNVVNEIGKAEVEGEIPQLQVALFQYGNSGLESADSYVQLRSPFTTDLDVISEQLFSLSTNGGQEYCGAVIRESLKQLDWGQSQDGPALRMIVIAGNEPFNQGTEPYKESIATARGLDIKVNTIFCGNREEGRRTFWADGAKLGKGYCASINQNQKLPDIATPFDETIEALNEALNGTYLGYGAAGAAGKLRQTAQDSFNASASSFGSISRIQAKTSNNYSTSHWDIVSAVEEETIDLAKIEDNDLPKELQGKPLEQKQAEIAELSAERKRIAAEIQANSAKRDAYIAETRKEAAESGTALDDALISAMREQAQDVGFSFKD